MYVKYTKNITVIKIFFQFSFLQYINSKTRWRHFDPTKKLLEKVTRKLLEKLFGREFQVLLFTRVCRYLFLPIKY